MINRLVIVVLMVTLTGCASDKEDISKKSSIGSATMLANGVIQLQLRAEHESAIGDALFEIAPGDPEYEKLREHVGGLNPGEDKPVPPWDDATLTRPVP